MTLLAEAPAPTPVRTRRLAVPLGFGVAGLLVSIAFSWVPSLWYDESATVTSATRSIPQLWAMLHNLDAVHGLYYVGMHFWFELVGYSPFSLRFPSAVATAVSAALLIVLARRITTERVALISGVVFLLLPRVTWMGTEGRSYAFTVALGLALTLVFVVARSRSGAAGFAQARWWALYSVLAIMSGFTFIFLELLVVAHAATVALWFVRDRRAALGSAVGWATAVVVAGLALIPFVRVVLSQSAQVSWIDPLGVDTPWAVFVSQWFNRSPWLAVPGWIALAVGVALLVRGRYQSRLVDLVVPWLLGPTVVLLVASLVASPLYSARYVTFTAPAAAIVLAVFVSWLGSRRRVIVALCVLAALSVPMAVFQRTPESKQDSSWGEVAGLIASSRTSEPTGIIYGPVYMHPGATARVMETSYPGAFKGLIDVTIDTPAAETGHLWATDVSLSSSTAIARLDGVDTVWLVASTSRDARPEVSAELASLGYQRDGAWSFTNVNVVRYTR